MEISKLKILVAEDSPMNTLLMRKILGKWDIVPDFAANGNLAVEAFINNNYDLILMDIYMPIMDGYEATSAIRSYPDEVKNKVPIIALTASLASDVTEKMDEAGIDDYISKPFESSALLGILEKIAALKTDEH
jgi:CheY-like chemotaxis protein